MQSSEFFRTLSIFRSLWGIRMKITLNLLLSLLFYYLRLSQSRSVNASKGVFVGQVYVLTGTIREFVTFCELNFFACHVLKKFTLNLGPGEKF